MRPHVVTVIMTMLEGLSGMENPALNYLGNRLSAQGQVSLSFIDTMRNRKKNPTGPHLGIRMFLTMHDSPIKSEVR